MSQQVDETTRRTLEECIEQLEAENAQLKKELLRVTRAYLADVEEDIRIIGEYLASDQYADDADRREDLRWKRAYEDLAASKLGRIQRWYWGRTAKKGQGKAQ
ncbi:MAG: hypothetical protein IKD79_04730 [Oscillospiraceae bacterium]|nr:hypothetical protein [Oscillospiraceae bacterium]